jgi:hypothetical protein
MQEKRRGCRYYQRPRVETSSEVSAWGWKQKHQENNEAGGFLTTINCKELVNVTRYLQNNNNKKIKARRT